MPALRFVLDGRLHSVDNASPTTTVLDYLRETLGRTGTKEGCAEGDCGACVVLVGELTGEQVSYKPVNSCLQLLPSLDGKSLKTVESLKRADGSLHPVQQAFISCHASQCGFCTPGFIMSSVGLVQTVAAPSRLQITDALSGNLCRCTGYRPIIDAVTTACKAPRVELKLEDSADIALLKTVQRPKHVPYDLEGNMVSKPIALSTGNAQAGAYFAPQTLTELAALVASKPQGTLLAGSTEIGLQVNKKFSRPADIIYVGDVPELKTLTDTGPTWKIGAAVDLLRVEALMAEHVPDFGEVLRRFGSPPIRSYATLAGNIANGSPIGDTMPCLMALGAVLHLRAGKKTRLVSLAAFYTGMKANVMQPGEFIECVEVPKLRGATFRAHKVSKRFDQDISAVCSAMSYEIKAGVFKSVRVAYNGLAPAPCRAPKIEAVLEGRAPADIQAAELDAAIAASFVARDGLRATWEYRSLVARNLVLRFVEEAQPPVAVATV